MFENNSKEFHDLIDILKEKVKTNTTYYIVTSDFSHDNFKVYDRAMLIPSILGGESENVVLSVIYKVLPKDITIVETIEGIINISYSDLASFLIPDKIAPRYTEINKADKDIEDLVNIIKQH